MKKRKKLINSIIGKKILNAFSILELLMAVLVFSVGVLSFFSLIQTIQKNHKNIEIRYVALKTAENLLMESIGEKLSSPLGKNNIQTFEKNSFLVKKQVSKLSKHLYKLQITVEYYIMSSKKNVELLTFYFV